MAAGDVNAHSSQGDPRCRDQRVTAFWLEDSYEHGLEIGNDGRSTQNRTREDHKGESIVNYRLANRQIMRWTVVTDCHATESDHEVIE